MATISSSWTENQSVTFDDSTPEKETEAVGIIDLAANGYVKVVIQFEIEFGASANGNAEIRVRSSSNSGTDKDTILIWSQEVEFTVSTIKRITVPIEGLPYIQVGIYNGNAAVEVITVAAIYAGLEYSSA